MKLWLTQCDGGRFILTVFRPKIARIRGTERLDAFESIGEPIAVRYLCQPGILSLMGKLPPPLTPTRIELSAKFLDLNTLEAPPNEATAEESPAA